MAHKPEAVPAGSSSIPLACPLSKIAVVVERDDDLRETLVSYLQSQHFQVLAEPTPPDLESLRRLQPDLLLIDLLIDGELGGIDVLRGIHPWSASSIVVAMSADERLVARWQDELAHLATAVLVKPFDLDRFDDVIGVSGPVT